MSRMALTPTRPARRRSTSASLTMKLSTGLPFVLQQDAAAQLERAPEMGHVRAAQGPDVEPRDLDLAFAGPLVGIEETEEGGLARPARPAQDDELALLDAERDVAQSGQPHRPAFEDFTDVVEPDHGLRPFYLTLQTFGSFSSRREFTTVGLALPAVAFITCPTRKPRAAFLPPFPSRTTLGCCARTWSTTAESSPASATWVSPSRSTMARAASPERYIFSKTSLAIPPLMVPSSMRMMRSARFAGGIGHAARARSSSPASSRRSSLSTQFAATLGLPQACAVASK